MRYALLTLWLWSLVALGADPLTDGLVGWWPMREGSGTTIADASGNGNTGTLYNSPAWIAGYNGSNALSFTATSSTYVEIPDSATLDVTDTGSLCFWTKLTEYGVDKYGIVCKGNVVLDGDLSYGILYNGSSTFRANLGTQIGNVAAASTMIPTNTWIFLSMTWTTSETRLYMNGLLLGTKAGNGYGAKSVGYPLRFGANGDTSADSYMDGSIQGVRVYNLELSADDVNYIYTYEGGTAWYLPLSYLESLPKPQFKPGHTLPHLTDWEHGKYTNIVVELAKNWGYCLSLSYYATPTIAAQTGTPDNFNWAMVNMANTNSDFKLSVIIDRDFVAPIPDAFYCTNEAGEFVLNGDGDRVVCPEGDLVGADDYWADSTAYWLSSLQTINANGPIAIFLNKGEYGLNDAWHGWDEWAQDPRVQSQTVVTDPFWFPTKDVIVNTSGTSWNRYGSASKARTIGYMTKAIEENFPSRELSVFYHAGYEIYRTWTNNTVRNQNWLDVDGNGWWASYMNTNTDLPSFQLYYPADGYFGSGGWDGTYNLLTRYLNGVGYGITIGYTNGYHSITAGYSDTDESTSVLAPIDRYTGIIKCYYMAGMKGAIAGYFDTPAGPIGSLVGAGFNAPFPAGSPPHWLQQMTVLSRVHGLFSYLQSFVENSELLSGPQTHVMSRDQPAYEFTNHQAVATCRTLVRKLNDSDEWLLCAWAGDGTNRDITITVPTLGDVNLRAATTGNVYRATVTTGPQPVNNLGEVVRTSANNIRVNSIRGR